VSWSSTSQPNLRGFVFVILIDIDGLVFTSCLRRHQRKRDLKSCLEDVYLVLTVARQRRRRSSRWNSSIVLLIAREKRCIQRLLERGSPAVLLTSRAWRDGNDALLWRSPGNVALWAGICVSSTT